MKGKGRINTHMFVATILSWLLLLTGVALAVVSRFEGKKVTGVVFVTVIGGAALISLCAAIKGIVRRLDAGVAGKKGEKDVESS